tara:strand:- start:13398 stop:14342 length:945 start_codon:yes stop_codon:yes gene_type:complete
MISFKPTSVYYDIFQYLDLKEAVDEPHFTHALEMLSDDKFGAWEMREPELRQQLNTLTKLGFLTDTKCVQNQRWKLQLSYPLEEAIRKFDELVEVYHQQHLEHFGISGTTKKAISIEVVANHISEYLAEQGVIEGSTDQVMDQLGFRLGSPLELYETRRKRFTRSLKIMEDLGQIVVRTTPIGGGRGKPTTYQIWPKGSEPDSIAKEEEEAEDAGSLTLQSMMDSVSSLLSQVDAHNVNLNKLKQQVQQSEVGLVQLRQKIDALPEMLTRLKEGQNSLHDQIQHYMQAEVESEAKAKVEAELEKDRSWWSRVRG